jgi:hypothetical protein
MIQESIYRVWVESSAGGSQWRGTFNHPPEPPDIVEAINLDIIDLNPTVEHEADRIREYERLQEVVNCTSVRLVTGAAKVVVAGIQIGEITVTEENIFTISP